MCFKGQLTASVYNFKAPPLSGVHSGLPSCFPAALKGQQSRPLLSGWFSGKRCINKCKYFLFCNFEGLWFQVMMVPGRVGGPARCGLSAALGPLPADPGVPPPLRLLFDLFQFLPHRCKRVKLQFLHSCVSGRFRFDPAPPPAAAKV